MGAVEDVDATSGLLRGLLDERGLDDPYAVYRRLREEEAAGGDIGRIVVRHDQVSEVLTDRAMSSDRIPALLDTLPSSTREEISLVERTLRDIVAFRDPPDHGRLRRLLTHAFTPAVVRSQEGAVRRAAALLLDRIGDDAETDLRASLTFPLPAVVIGALLGVPNEDLERFQSWANDIVFAVGSGDLDAELALQTRDSMLEMRDYMTGLVDRRRRAPGDDLLSSMIAAADHGDRLSEDEIYANAVFLMTAGHETATNMLSNGLIALLRHPDQLARLRADPSLIETAAEEMLRFESPVQITARFATEDRELCGRQLRRGDALVLVIGAANRDPAVFSDPDRFDVGRDPNRHLAFSWGSHFCLGAWLARLELTIVVPMVLARSSTIRLRDDEIDWQPTLSFRGPTSLWVRW